MTSPSVPVKINSSNGSNETLPIVNDIVTIVARMDVKDRRRRRSISPSDTEPKRIRLMNYAKQQKEFKLTLKENENEHNGEECQRTFAPIRRKASFITDESMKVPKLVFDEEDD